MGTTEVTREQFRTFINATGYETDAEKQGWAFHSIMAGTKFIGWTNRPGITWRMPGFDQGPDHPVAGLSWRDAKAFCVWLSRETGEVIRLPSEAEWENAARAGTLGNFAVDGEHSWYHMNANFGTNSVKGRKPNPLGLYDMFGNVWEWNADVWHRNYTGIPLDGSPWKEGGDSDYFPAGEGRICKSSPWSLGPGSPGSRNMFWERQGCSNAGFRVVLIPADQKKNAPPTAKSPAFVQIPAGSLQIKTRVITFRRPFEMSSTEVTVGQFRKFADSTRYRTTAETNGWVWRKEDDGPVRVSDLEWKSPGFPQTDDHPVTCLSFEDARAYTRWLSQTTGRYHRLPSEMEWTYAAQAGDTGDRPEDVDSVAWHTGNSNGSTRPVATKKPNDWQLFDMFGNVGEYCLDVWHEAEVGHPEDGSPWLAGTAELPYRKVRGDSFQSNIWWGFYYDRSDWIPPDAPFTNLGFRVVRVPIEKEEPARALPKAAPKDLETVLKAADASARREAISRLAGWPDVAPAPTLMEVLRLEEDTENRIQALRAYLQMIAVSDNQPERYREALGLAVGTERSMVIDALDNLPELETLDILKPLWRDPTLSEKASILTVKLAKKLYPLDQGGIPRLVSDLKQSTTSPAVLNPIEELEKEFELSRGYVMLWKGTGPFSGGDVFNTAFGPEKGNFQGLEWQDFPARVVFLNQAFTGDKIAAYMRSSVYSQDSIFAKAHIKSFSRAKAWVNGIQLNTRSDPHDYREHVDVDEIELKKGWNEVLIKVVKDNGPYLFSFQLTDLEGTPLETVKVSISEF
jgi:formylglycine-generating enzyme required for sulfatase activity